jgi:acetyltransferase-like isoleucine patch superfamily enzyme
VESASIGDDTQIGAFAHICPGARAGAACHIGNHVFIENDVVIGDRVIIQCGAQIWDGITLEDDVFVGPNAIFTNQPFPGVRTHDPAARTIVRRGASIGAQATILAGIAIGERAVVGPGAVVARDVQADTVVTGNPARTAGYVGSDEAALNALGLPPAPAEPATEPSRVRGVVLRHLPLVDDLRGFLSFGEAGQHVPFAFQRYFLVFGVPGRDIRGEHAHRTLHQFLVCVHGTCHAIVDDGRARQEYVLDSPHLGLYVPPMCWCVQYKFSADGVLLVLASDRYDAGDYIRTYAEFLKTVQARDERSV